MEPVLLVCGDCGVRLRTHRPEKARERVCPRCESSLRGAVDLALGIDLGTDRPPEATTHSPGRWLTTAGLAVLIAVGSLTILAAREASPVPSPIAPPPSNRVETVAAGVTALGLAEPPATGSSIVEAGEVVMVDEVPVLSNPPARDLASLDLGRRDPIPLDPTRIDRLRGGLLDRPAPPPPVPSLAADPTTPEPPCRPGEPRRLLVRDARGRAIVAREYGMLKDRPAVILPDGQIGWPEGLVVAQEPFVPLTMGQMKQELLSDPEFAAFRIYQTAHYLVMYQSGEPFARASADLLEKLLDGLTGTLKRSGLPVVPMEFPLVAVIFATEGDFRASRRVAPDVQAYYEIRSNRIYFYEKSGRDQDSPEVSALRKPQTVAHEGTHQILHNVGIQPRLSDWPLWLVEGLAEYCSSTRFTKKGVEWAGLGQANPIHLATIRDLDDPIPGHLKGDRREEVGRRDRGMPLVEYLVTRKELTPTDYAFSWALTHYLIVHRPDEFVAYLKRLGRLKPDEEQSPADQLAAFRAAFGSDLAQMDGKVGKHLKKLKPGDSLPHYAVIFEQSVGPVAVRRQYLVSQSPSVIRQWIESVSAPEGGQPHWRVFPHPSQKKALEAAEQWITGGH